MSKLVLLDFNFDTTGLLTSSQCNPATGSNYQTFTIKQCTTVNCTTVNCTTINCTTIQCNTTKCTHDNYNINCSNDAVNKDA